jgi:hypothetical protein
VRQPECQAPVDSQEALNRYVCPDCKKQGPCVVSGSSGIEQRRARIRSEVIFAVFVAVLVVLVLTGHGSWLGSGGG